MATIRSFTTAAALLMCATSAVAQAPANDDCGTAIAATAGVLAPYDTTNATDGAGLALDPLVCNMGPFGDDQIYADIWYSFTPATTGTHVFAAAANGNPTWDSRIAVYNQAACPDDPLNVELCDDDGGPALEALASGWVDSANTYLVRIGSYDAAVVPSPGALDITYLGAVPANDTCLTASAAALGNNPVDSTTASDSGTALDAMVCDMGGFGDEQLYADVWLTFTPAATDFYDIAAINNGGTAMDSRLAIYNTTACPADPANVIDCDDDSGPGLEAAMTGVNLTGGTSYLIRMGSYDANTPEQPAVIAISVGMSPNPPPANDDCGNAIAVGTGFTAFDSRFATDGAGLPLDPVVCDMGTFGDDQLYQDVWFTFTVPAMMTGNWQVASVNNANPTFDSRIAVYDQSTCPDDPALVIACDDDAGPVLEAQVSVAMFAGSTYTIRIGSYDGFTAEQPAALSIGFIGSLAPNNDCATATPITAFGLYGFDTSLASTTGLDLMSGGGTCEMGTFGDDQIHNDVFYAYTPDVGGCTYVSTFGFAGFDTRIAVYDGGACPADPLNVLACNDDESLDAMGNPQAPFEAGMDVELVAGNSYIIRVGTYAGGILGGPATLNIAAGPQADANNLSGTPQVGAPGCAAAPAFNEFCFGDGGNQMGCTNCPCTNNAIVGSGGGCANSSGDGIQLIPSGDPSVSLPSGDTTDLRFGADGAPPTAFCILNSGDALAPGNMANPCFGLGSGAQAAAFDGLRCAIMNTRRHGGRSADVNGDVGVTNNPWGGEGGPPVGLANAGLGFAAGQTRFFQIINRDNAMAVCMRGLNTSQAVEVTFTP